MPPNSVLIKKYENRRLYDATNSRYVNLEDVAQLLKDGHDVQVVDAATGNDITRLILTQIIVEDAKAPNSTFPLDLLRQMIITSGQASQETAVRYMKTMLDLYQDTYRAMTPAVNPFGFFAQRAAGSAAPAEPPSTTASPAAVNNNGPVSTEADELKQRVAELEKMVASLAPKKVRARRILRRK